MKLVKVMWHSIVYAGMGGVPNRREEFRALGGESAIEFLTVGDKHSRSSCYYPRGTYYHRFMSNRSRACTKLVAFKAVQWCFFDW